MSMYQCPKCESDDVSRRVTADVWVDWDGQVQEINSEELPMVLTCESCNHSDGRYVPEIEWLKEWEKK